MDEDKIELTCEGCGQTFVAFLKGMAEHNAKVVCPKCRKVYDRARAMQLVKQKSGKSGE